MKKPKGMSKRDWQREHADHPYHQLTDQALATHLAAQHGWSEQMVAQRGHNQEYAPRWHYLAHDQGEL